MNRRIVFIGLIALALTSAIVAVSSHRALSGSSDFDTYYYAAKSIAASGPVYTVSHHAVNPSKSPYVYPPFFACAISVLSIFPMPVAASIWNLLNALLFVACFMLIHQTVSGGENIQGWFAAPFSFSKILFWVLSLMILVDNLAMAQVNLMVFFLLLLSLESYRSKKEISSGFWMGMATAIKLIPAIFFLYFLIERRWRALLGGLLAFLFCFWVIPALMVGNEKNATYHKAWFSETIMDHAKPLTLPFYASQLNPSEQNLRAAVFRWVIDWEFRERTGGPNGRAFIFRPPWRLNEAQAGDAANSASLILFLILCAGLVYSAAGKKGVSNFYAVISCLLTAMVLLSPKMRSHMFVFLWFPWAVLIRSIQTGKHKGKFLPAVIFSLSAIFYLLQGIPYMKFLGAGAFSSLVLFVYFILQLFRRSERVEL